MARAYFAGIGSRRIPRWAFDLMVETTRLLAARHSLRLRTGGADGADTACANGVMLWEPSWVDIFLPWPGYNGIQIARLERSLPQAYEVAARYHPYWQSLSQGARHLHARNSHIVLGPDLDDPVSFVLCWTPDGTLDGCGPDSGGTGQALRVICGEAPHVPIFNFARADHLGWIKEFAGAPVGSPQ